MRFSQLRLVMAGGECNMKCAYCVAGYSNEKYSCMPQVLNEEKLNTVIGAGTFPSISIWGGEPFYNFSALQQSVDFCVRKFPETPILIISNGTAFSQEKIDFVVKHKLHITLSHDGYNQFYRGKDYLADTKSLELIKQIPDVAFSSVLHQHNCDIPALFHFFEEAAKSLDREVSWGFELFQLPSPKALQFLPHGKNLLAFANSIDFLLAQFQAGHPFAYSAVYNTLNSMARIIDQDKSVLSRCGACNRLTVTTDGRKAYCQVQAEKDSFIYPALVLSEMCRQCEVAKFCAGICPTVTDAYRKKMCVIYKLFYTKLARFLIGLR